jgi:hypothetical protein
LAGRTLKSEIDVTSAAFASLPSRSGWPAIVAWWAPLVRRLNRNAGGRRGGREDVDLTRQVDVERWMDKQRPDAIVLAPRE